MATSGLSLKYLDSLGVIPLGLTGAVEKIWLRSRASPFGDSAGTDTHLIQTIELPSPTKTIYIRKPAKPSEKAIGIYQATNTDKIMTPTVKYVVYH